MAFGEIPLPFFSSGPTAWTSSLATFIAMPSLSAVGKSLTGSAVCFLTFQALPLNSHCVWLAFPVVSSILIKWDLFFLHGYFGHPMAIPDVHKPPRIHHLLFK